MVRPRLEQFEPRVLLCAEHAQLTVLQDGQGELGTYAASEPVGSGNSNQFNLTGSNGATHPLTDIPVLNSLAGAPASLYLDFDGHYEAVWGAYTSITTPVFDQDGDPLTFSDGELSAMHGIWARVAENYAPFNINVTTVQPSSFADGVAMRVAIGGDNAWLNLNAGGVAYVASFTDSHLSNTVFVFTKNLDGIPTHIGDAASHEVGHSFGLHHQSQFDGAGNKIREYYGGPGDGRAPIMGDHYQGVRSLWWYGTPDIGPTFSQDDMAVISSNQNGFGYRPDDHPGTTPLTVSRRDVGGAGIIETTSDRDSYTFTTAASGEMKLSVEAPLHVGNLNARLELFSSSGALLAVSDPPGFDYTRTIQYTGSAGNYILVVASHGGYGDVGQYTVSGTIPVPNPFRLIAPASPNGGPADQVAGRTFQVEVQAQDFNGNLDTSFAGTVHFELEYGRANFDVYSATGYYYLPDNNYTFTPADAGRHTFDVTLRQANRTYLKVSRIDDPGLFGDIGIRVAPAAAASFQVEAAPEPAVAGWSHDFTVTVKDRFGNVVTPFDAQGYPYQPQNAPAPGYAGTVFWSSNDPHAELLTSLWYGTLSAPYQFQLSEGGVHTFKIKPKTAGWRTFTVTAPVLGSAPITAQTTLDVESAIFWGNQYAEQPSFSAEWTPTALTTGDLNGDGNLDVVVADAANSVWIRFGEGEGGFRPGGLPLPSGGLQPVAVAIGYFHHNPSGLPDIAVVNRYAFAGADHGSVGILLNSGDPNTGWHGGFLPDVNSYPVGAFPFGIAANEFGSSGTSHFGSYQDLIVSQSNGVTVLLSNSDGSGTFLPNHVELGYTPVILKIGDLDPTALASGTFTGYDAVTDVLVMKFIAGQETPIPGMQLQLLVGDKTLAPGEQLYGTPTGTFTPISIGNTSPWLSSGTVPYLRDPSESLDLVAFDYANASLDVFKWDAIYQEYGTHTSAPYQGWKRSEVRVVPFEGRNAALIESNGLSGPNQTIELFLGSGSQQHPAFDLPLTYVTAWPTTPAIGTGDLNHDGLDDLFYTSWNGSISVLVNQRVNHLKLQVVESPVFNDDEHIAREITITPEDPFGNEVSYFGTVHFQVNGQDTTYDPYLYDREFSTYGGKLLVYDFVNPWIAAATSSITVQHRLGAGPIDFSSTVATPATGLGLSVANLRSALVQRPGSLAIRTNATLSQQAVIAEVNQLKAAIDLYDTDPTNPNALPPLPYPVTLTVDLSGGTYSGVTVGPPKNMTLVINGASGTNTFVGQSPAFTVTSGSVKVIGVTFTNSTDAPTILVTGGALTLRNSTVQETTGGSQAAVSVTGGTADLGTSTNPGGNLFNVHGAGVLIRNTTTNQVVAVGSTFGIDDVPMTEPLLFKEAYTVSEHLPLTGTAVSLLNSHIDPNGMLVTAVLVTGPAHGATVMNPDGSFTYTPEVDYVGVDSFIYRPRRLDGTLSRPAMVTLTVLPDRRLTHFALSSAINQPTSITAGAAGDQHLYFTEATGIGRVNIDGTYMQEIYATGGTVPGFILIGPNNHLWFTQTDSIGDTWITAISANGDLIYETPTPVTHGASSLAYDADRNAVWFTSSATNQVGILYAGSATKPTGTTEYFAADFVDIYGQSHSYTTASIVYGSPENSVWLTSNQLMGGLLRVQLPPISATIASESVQVQLRQYTTSGWANGYYLSHMYQGTSRLNGLTFGPDGNLWAVGSFEADGHLVYSGWWVPRLIQNSFLKIDRMSGNVIAEYGLGDHPVPTFLVPTTLPNSGSGVLIFSDNWHRMESITMDGRFEWVTTIDPVQVQDITLSPADGNLWFTDSTGIGRFKISNHSPELSQLVVGRYDPLFGVPIDAATLISGGTLTYDEGDHILFDATATSDVDAEDPSSLIYHWEFDNLNESILGQPFWGPWVQDDTDGRADPVTVTVTDWLGGSTSFRANIRVNNLPPEAIVNSISTDSLVPGEALALDLAAWDPSPVDRAALFTYEMDWGDGTPVQHTSAPANAIIKHGYGMPSPPEGYSITIHVIDKDGGRSTSAATVTGIMVAGNPTTASISPELDSGVQSQERSFVLETNSTDPSTEFEFDMDWNGDGQVDEQVFGPNGTTATHVFPFVGDFHCTVAIPGQATPTPFEVVIESAGLQGDDLFIGGTANNEDFVLTPGGNGQLNVARSGVDLGAFSFGGSVHVIGGGGTDTVTIVGSPAADVLDVQANSLTFNGMTVTIEGIHLLHVIGNGGSDTVNINDSTGTIESEGSLTFDIYGGSATIHSGGSSTFNIFGGSATIHADGSADTLIAAGVDPNAYPWYWNDWQITGSDAGTLSLVVGGTTTFDGIENLTGGMIGDGFHFRDGGSVSGVIDDLGGGGSLDFSSLTGGAIVNLATGHAATRDAISGQVHAIVGAFVNIGSLEGSVNASDNILIGPDQDVTWTLDVLNFDGFGHAAGGGAVQGIGFGYFQSLVGGSGNDIFVDDYNTDFYWAICLDCSGPPAPSTSVRSIDGGGGTANILSLSNYLSGATVDLRDRRFNDSFSFDHIQSVSFGVSTLYGPDSGATWVFDDQPGFTVDGIRFASAGNRFAGQGDDNYTVTAASSYLLLDGGEGSDTYDITFGDLNGDVEVADTGSIGTDSLTINGTSQADLLSKNAGWVKWQPAVGEPYQEVDFSDIESQVTLNAGAGNDTIHDPNSGNFLILGGEGDDIIQIQDVTEAGVVADGGPGNNTYIIAMGNLNGPVTINNTTGTSSLTFLAPAGANTLILTANQLSTSSETIHLNLGTTATNITVDGSAGTNQLVVQGPPPGPVTPINILGGNRAPAITAIGNQECSDTVLTVRVAAQDPDLGDTLSYSVSFVSKAGAGAANAPTGFSIDSNGIFHWTPGGGQLGQYTFRARVNDHDGLFAERTFVVTTLGLVDGVLIIVGTSGADKIDIKPTDGDADELTVRINEKDYRYKLKPKNNPDNPYSGVALIHVCGLGGDDQISVQNKVTTSTLLEGGSGNDNLQGGSGNDILVGGAGNDILSGNDGRDVMIGGLGADNLTGNKDEDLLIAGWTAFDSNLSALNSIMLEWGSSASAATRIAHLTITSGGLNAGAFLRGNDGADQTVFDDNAVDRLTGSQGIDWFLANTLLDNSLVKDIIADLSNGELAGDIDL